MIEKGQRGIIRTGTAALGATLMAIALAASPVGATPFTGHDSGQFWALSNSDSNGDGIPASQSLTSGYSTFAGASECVSLIEYEVNPAPSGSCDGVELSLVPGSGGTCQTEDGDGVVRTQVVEATSCLPFSCFDANSAIVAGCTATWETEIEVIGGTGMYADATGSYTTTGTSTYTTQSSGTFSSDTTGNLTLAGDAPPDDVFLDSPAQGSTQSGIGVVSGWSCLGGHLEVELREADGTLILTDPLPHGAYRPTTQDACGDTANGFSMPMNWGRLQPGAKTLTVSVNGVERVTRNFSVTTFGEEFITDAGGRCEIADFRDGQNATFVWEQANQGLVLGESLN